MVSHSLSFPKEHQSSAVVSELPADMPATLFIPEEHNCCYRYSYSEALHAAAAWPQLILQYNANYMHTHKYTAAHAAAADCSHNFFPPAASCIDPPNGFRPQWPACQRALVLIGCIQNEKEFYGTYAESGEGVKK